MVERCRICKRVRAGGEWFESGLIYFTNHDTRLTVCADCARRPATTATPAAPTAGATAGRLAPQRTAAAPREIPKKKELAGS